MNNSLSTILADMEASVTKVKTLEAELTTEKQRGRDLAAKYRTESGDILKSLGIDEPKKERKVRTQDEVLLGSATRRVKQMVDEGEKNPKALLAGALEASLRIGKSRFGLTELPAEFKAQIEEKLKGAVVKK